ncbi:MAG: ANTAR domain-containing response regulator [Eubacteriaceae bacterium]
MRALLISKRSDSNQRFIETLRSLGIQFLDTVASGSEARRRIQEIQYDLVLIDAPLKDEQGIELALDLVEQEDFGILLLVKREVLEEVEEKVLNSNIFLLEKPIDKESFRQSFRFVLQMQKKFRKLQLENKKLQQKIEDNQMMFRGKLCLMERVNMNESDAHRYIQKKAMDMGLTPGQIGKRILKNYEKRK